MWKSSLHKMHGRHHNLIEISLWQWIFYFFNEIFFPPSLQNLLPDLPVYMSNTAGVLWEAGTACPSSPPFYVEYVMLFFLLLFCVMRHTFRVPCCDLRCDFCIKTMFGSSLLPVVCIIYVICVCLRIVVSNIYCVVFWFVSSFVTCVARFSGLFIFVLSLRYSLTFIKQQSLTRSFIKLVIVFLFFSYFYDNANQFHYNLYKTLFKNIYNVVCT